MHCDPHFGNEIIKVQRSSVVSLSCHWARGDSAEIGVWGLLDLKAHVLGYCATG